MDNKGQLAWIRNIILDQKHSVIVNIKVKPKTDLGGFISHIVVNKGSEQALAEQCQARAKQRLANIYRFIF